MTLQTKDEIIANLGKYGLLDSAEKKLLNKVGYLGGVPLLDDKLANKKKGEYSINLEVRPRGLEIVTTYLFTNFRVGLLTDQIDFFVIEPQKQIVEKKSKSIVGRALLGGVLLGPVGAIVGGMTGIGNKEVKVFPVDNILSIKVNNPDTLLTLSVDNKNFKSVENYLQKFFKPKYKRFDEVEHLQSKSITNHISVADELLKLKSLFESGVLTQEEFEKQKQKLLNS